MPAAKKDDGASSEAPEFDELNIDHLAERYGLPVEYVERVKIGLEPYPPVSLRERPEGTADAASKRHRYA
jgi:hypothetical protein